MNYTTQELQELQTRCIKAVAYNRQIALVSEHIRLLELEVGSVNPCKTEAETLLVLVRKALAGSIVEAPTVIEPSPEVFVAEPDLPEDALVVKDEAPSALTVEPTDIGLIENVLLTEEATIEPPEELIGEIGFLPPEETNDDESEELPEKAELESLDEPEELPEKSEGSEEKPVEGTPKKPSSRRQQRRR